MQNYGDERQGFAVEITDAWTEHPLDRTHATVFPGRAPNPGVCLRSCDGAVVTVSTCIAGPSVVSDPSGRTKRIYEELCAEAPGARQNWDAFRPIPGSINIASGQIIGRNGAAGLISIVHSGVEYSIRYAVPITSPFSAIKKVNDLMLSFRLRCQPSVELFVDPEKRLQGRRRWWHFWRWLGQ